MSRGSLFGGLCATVFLVHMGRVVFAPLLQPVAADFGVTAASLGVVASAAWLGSALPRLPTGYILTFVPRHHVILVTGALLVVTSAGTGLAQSIVHLTLGAFLMGLSSGMYFIAALPLVSELFPGRVGRALGIHGMSEQLAAVSAPLIVGGILLVTDWRMTFFAIAIGAIVSTVVLVVGVRLVDLPRAGRDDRSLVGAARMQWRLILTGIVITAASVFLWNALFNLYGDYLETVKGIDPETGRVLLSLMFAAGIPAWVIGGVFADRFPKVPTMVSVLFAFGIGVLGLTLVEGVIAIALVSIAIGLIFFMLPPTLDTYLLATLPDQHRASSYAWYSSVMMLIMSLGSGTVGTLVGSGIAYDSAMRVMALTVLGTAVLIGGLYLANRLPTGTKL